MKRLMIIVAVALLVLMIPGTACADDAYDIVSYDVHVVVDEHNVAEVTETMTCNFTQARHGLYYYLQYKGPIFHYIGGEWVKSTYRYQISDFDVAGRHYETSIYHDESDKASYIEAKIGDADTYMSGEQVFEISYMCDIGNDGYDTFDEFNRSIVNADWGDTVKQATFTVELPKDFDDKAISIGIGEYYDIDEEGVVWEKSGSTITGYTTRPINGGESLMVRVALDEDYFVGESVYGAGWNDAILIVTGAAVLLALVLWIAFGRDRPLYPTVEFYAPDGMTPAEAGYVIDGCVDDKDVVALILYWADKGYLRIVEEDKKEFTLFKLKDMQSGGSVRAYERTMFSKLFAKGDAVSLGTLRNSFYMTMSATKASVTNYFEGSKKRRVFTTQSKKARAWMGVITMLPIAFATFVYGYLAMDTLLWAAFIAVLAGWLISLPVFMLAHTFEKWRGMKKGSRVVRLIVSIFILILVLVVYIVVLPVAFDAPETLSAVLTTFVTAVATVVLVILTVIMRKRTKQGDVWMGKLLGFKNFIDKAEKDRIRLLVEENPEYFYNILPYAYVLGVTDKWAKNFEGIGVEPPGWYQGYGTMSTFNTIWFASAMTHSMGRFQTTMTSRPSSSGSGGSGFHGGGGFGGGGFSGGGGGGGGFGGSW